MESDFSIGRWRVQPQLNLLLGPENQSIQIEPKVMEVLVYLAEHAGIVLPKERILQAVWPDTSVTEDVLVHAVVQLRKAFGDNAREPRFIQTVPKRGYRLLAPVLAADDSRSRYEGKDAPGGGRALWIRYVTAASVLVAAAVLVWHYLRSREAVAPPLRVLPLTSWVGSELDPALSPRGDQVAFVSDIEARPRYDLYVMMIGSAVPLRLTRGPGSASKPAWSPDGREVAYLLETEGGALQVVAIPALGGRERSLGTLMGGRLRGLDWSPDAKWLATVAQGPGGGPPAIFLISTETGEILPFTSPPPGIVGDKNPVFSTSGKDLAFVRWYDVQRSEIYVRSLGGGDERLLMVHEGWIQGLDWMPDSSALVFSSIWMGTTGLWKVSTEGNVTQLSFGQNAEELSIAPLGGRLAFSQLFSDANIWRAYGPAAAARGAPHQLISSTREDWAPQYSPDGSKIALTSDRTGIDQIWLCNSEGADCSQLTTEGPSLLPRWSVDGRMIAFAREAAGNLDVYTIDAAGGFPRRLTSAAAADIPWSWSRDGLWIYYFSGDGGKRQVWKVPAKGGAPEPITGDGGMYPRESADGRFLYYCRDDSNSPGIWRLPVSGGREELVLQKSGLSPYGFELWLQSLIYVVRNPRGGTAIERFDLESGQVEKLTDLDAASRIGRMSISPDGRWILFTQNDGRPGDLLLVENFSEER